MAIIIIFIIHMAIIIIFIIHMAIITIMVHIILMMMNEIPIINANKKAYILIHMRNH